MGKGRAKRVEKKLAWMRFISLIYRWLVWDSRECWRYLGRMENQSQENENSIDWERKTNLSQTIFHSPEIDFRCISVCFSEKQRRIFARMCNGEEMSWDVYFGTKCFVVCVTIENRIKWGILCEYKSLFKFSCLK